MAIIFSSPIFGPVHSRRLGVSLGINLLPGDGKFCSFDCIYCECGFNKDTRPSQALPTQEEVQLALESALKEMRIKGQAPDVLTFAGNGEPTAHPHFAAIIEDTLMLRNQYFPNAKVSVLSNATFIHRADVFAALHKVDQNILKLDTVDEGFIQQVDRPNAAYNIEETVEKLKAFRGNCIIQTMFLKGSYEGVDINNTTEAYVLPWIKALQAIAPKQVMIYTIDRETPAHQLQKATRAELDHILLLLHQAGFKATASY